jgi:hypothetical protein
MVIRECKWTLWEGESVAGAHGGGLLGHTPSAVTVPAEHAVREIDAETMMR